MAEPVSVSIIIGAAIGVAAILSPLIYKGIRYIIDLHICVKLMKQRLTSVEGVADNSGDTHSDIYKKVNKIERNLFHLMGKMNVTPVD